MKRLNTDICGDGRTIAILLFLLISLAIFGCRTSTSHMKQGSLGNLLSPQAPGESLPLESEGIQVEKIHTELESQEDVYRIGPNDVLNISVLEHEEVSSARDFNRGIVGTVVKKDGQIYLPIVGSVKATGYTVEEFHKILRNHLKKYIQDPQLTVDILRYESKKFFVLGAVQNPGAFPVNGATTLLEGIGLAKGVTPEGSLEGAYVVRDRALLPINLADLLLRGNTSRNIYMKNGDLVYVPFSQDQRVYVFGEVREPKAVQIPQGRLTLTAALAEAGGILPVEAHKRSIKLIRGGWQQPTVYTLSYKTTLTYGEGIYLTPGDRVVVQPTSLTQASRYMKQILPFLQAADSGTAIYDRLAQ